MPPPGRTQAHWHDGSMARLAGDDYLLDSGGHWQPVGVGSGIPAGISESTSRLVPATGSCGLRLEPTVNAFRRRPRPGPGLAKRAGTARPRRSAGLSTQPLSGHTHASHPGTVSVCHRGLRRRGCVVGNAVIPRLSPALAESQWCHGLVVARGWRPVTTVTGPVSRCWPGYLGRWQLLQRPVA